MNLRRKTIFIALFLFFIFSAKNAAADEVGDRRFFYINSDYDYNQREKINATLVKLSSKVYFYVDETWWASADQEKQKENLDIVAAEFENKIVPLLSSYLGREWSPGIDGDIRITVLLHPMKKEVGGYFKISDEYEKLQASDSNEREMVYLNAEHMDEPKLLKGFLAHEFVHLITFNKKTKENQIEEDVWLDEARAEYISTFLGYNNNYQGSILEKRVQYFGEKPNDPLLEWNNTKYDYGSVSLFTHYLADHYGIAILKDSLASSNAGVDSINYALKKNGFKKSFSDIYQDWLVAVLINDCNYGSLYCYLDKNLKNIYLSPNINFLPITGSSTLTMSDDAKIWSGNWYKIIGGGGGQLKFSFNGQDSAFFKLIYIARNQSGGYNIKSLNLNNAQNGEFYIENFGKEVNALLVIPYLDPDKSDIYLHSFSWAASIKRTQDDSEEISRLLAIIEDLKKQIADIIAQKGISCSQISNNLSIGMQNNSEVKCLQEFLKLQGADIYPEGLVTGNFGNFTRSAVRRFQEKYKSEILAPSGLQNGTGFAGPATRKKINALLNER